MSSRSHFWLIVTAVLVVLFFLFCPLAQADTSPALSLLPALGDGAQMQPLHALGAAPFFLTTDPGAGAGLTQADVDKAVQAALSKRDDEWRGQFKTATGHDSLDAFKEAKAKEKGEEAKLLEERTAELSKARGELESLRIERAIHSAAAEAVDPSVVAQLLAGQAKVEGGTVTIGGKTPAEAVAALLKEKPYLAKPAGGAGGGTPQNGGGGKQLSRAEFDKLDPAARAKHLKENGTVV